MAVELTLVMAAASTEAMAKRAEANMVTFIVKICWEYGANKVMS